MNHKGAHSKQNRIPKNLNNQPDLSQAGFMQNTNQVFSDSNAKPRHAAVGNQQNKDKRSRIVFRIALVVFIAALIGLGAIAFQYWIQDKNYEDMEQYVQVSDSENVALADLKVDWDALQAINPDIVAWIYVPDTKINYPVVQGADNEEYLHKSFDSTEGWLASAGTIFLDSSNTSTLTDKNNALYGHHMNNGSMFACLTDWADSDTFNKNRTIYILTPRGNYRLCTFAVVKTVGSDAIVQTSFANNASYKAYIQDKLDRSLVTQEGQVLTANDIYQSFLLSTCEYTQNDGRMIVCAAVVETTVVSTVNLLDDGKTADTSSLSTSTGTTGLTEESAKEIGQL